MQKNVEFASVATALASSDLPVPGGPKRRTPEQPRHQSILTHDISIHFTNTDPYTININEEEA